ncbi:Predicted flavoprotein CzcO associated with the cation diffusion facilitator CzcD [Aquimarina amphilecti]|uniref:Predicted flavoprotein CzcO associated with the cation diffusion facilitator CzcD n=1 Tax=Aquimarina amphilecti TaxID=1038014 RepID=A0A1H7GR77_AQUAM|nr:NAD(P)/FAD-dependent oxidoreductase [Aquimarina amphilecti]SEK40666.1 Predicted flavoprotein CzcO associated with the cation diffusion facilitator CzcD [Aquimarina amphilecti]
MSIRIVKNLIIGAGPAGLAVAGRFREQNVSFEIIEKTNKIAWSWHHHYDRLLLHTVKELSYLPHLEFPKEYPRYVPKAKLTQYYEFYAKHFNINPQFNLEVKSIKRENGHWLVKTNKQNYQADNVIVATGVNRVPLLPIWKNQENFNGEIIHSRNYKNAKPFIGKKVLVVGMGNTGAELALDLSEHNIDVSISVRSPLLIVPRDINGRSVQLTARKLERLPFGLGRWIGKQVRKVVIGDLSKYGILSSIKDPIDHLRQTGKTPVIDLGTVKQIKSNKIKVVGDITSFYTNGVQLKNDIKLDFDVVLLATGYRAKISDFIENTDELLDQYNIPKKVIADGMHKGLYFVGFDNYKLGGILGTIVTDSKTIVLEIMKGNK